MARASERLRADPTALVGRPASDLWEVLDEVRAAFDARPGRPLVELPSDRPVAVIGDSHGDWPAVSSALRFARGRSVPERFVGLGDYIHRATRAEPDPAALPSGSVWNVAYLLAWASYAPDDVILLRGNHEATRQIPVPAPTLLRELGRAYPRVEVLPLWESIVGLLERLPLAARTQNGVFLAHGGIPDRSFWDPARWEASNLRLLEGLLWSDPELEYEDRAVGAPYGPDALDAFLRAVGCRVMVKGHAPNHSGRSLYGGRLLTVHTSDLFARFGEGGVLLAEIPARERIESSADLTLRAWDGAEWIPRAIRHDPELPGPPTGVPAATPATDGSGR